MKRREESHMKMRWRFTRGAASAVCSILCAGALSGCAARAPEMIATPVTVRVPVAEPIYCAAPKLGKPALPISGLAAGSAPADTVRAYAATVAVLKGAVAERDAILAGCTRPAAPGGAKETR